MGVLRVTGNRETLKLLPPALEAVKTYGGPCWEWVEFNDFPLKPAVF